MVHPGAGVAAHCYRHPKREAYVRCTRCDRPICPDCMRPASVGFHCPDDVSAGSKSVRTPRSAVGAKLLDSPPYVTIVLGLLNVALYVYTGLNSSGGLGDPTRFKQGSLFYNWQLFPPFVHDGKYYELVTSGFLHISPLHIASNMLALGILGPPVEALLGRARFGALYFLATVGGSAACYAFGGRLDASVGASGAIFGLFGAALLMYRQLRLNPQYLVGTIALNFVLTFSIPGISKWGHIGGFVTGLLCGLAIAGWPTRRGRMAAPLQAGGLAGVAALLVVIIVARSATW